MSRKFQCKAVPRSWLELEEHRLNAKPYFSGAIEAKLALEKLNCEQLVTLTENGKKGIFNGPRFSRVYVNDPMHGLKLLSGADILQSDLSYTDMIAKWQAHTMPEMVLKEGTTLISSYGTIGRCVYTRADMVGAIGSDNVLKVVPDVSRILPGYLYSFLSSKFGVPLVIKGEGGSVVTYLDPSRVHSIPIPRLGNPEDRAHDLVQRAADSRVSATNLIEKAVEDAYLKLGMPIPPHTSDNRPSLTIQSSRLLLSRMDSFYYTSGNLLAREAFSCAADRHGCAKLGDIANVWIPNIFKRIHVDDPTFGYPYFTGKEIYEISPSTDLHLKKQIADNNQLVLTKGMILVQDSGQLSGLIGRPVQVGKHLVNAACTNNMVRIYAKNKYDNGFLFALLATRYGTSLLKREAAGSSIPHLDENRIRTLEIPWPETDTRNQIGAGVWEALDLRDQAIDLEREAREMIESTIEAGAR